jgi:hypothetical protein
MYGSKIFLTLSLAGGEWSASRSSSFTPGERAPSIHWIRGWVDPRDSLDDVEKRKFLTLPVLKLDPSVIQPVASRYTNYAIPSPAFSIIGPDILPSTLLT